MAFMATSYRNRKNCDVLENVGNNCIKFLILPFYNLIINK